MSASQPWTLKRLAWAYGCASKGSTEESSLREELERRVREPVVVHLRLRGRQLIDETPRIRRGEDGGQGRPGRVEVGIHRGQTLLDEAARIEGGGRLQEETPS